MTENSSEQRHSATTTDTTTETAMSTDIPTFDIPEYRDLTKTQAIAIIDEWGHPPHGVEVDRDRGTASVSTPPMSVEQIALIVLHAATHGTSVSAYLSCCGRNNGYDLDPAFVRERVADDGHLQDYRTRMGRLQQIVEEGEVPDDD
jgi:hypothetical protein